MVREIALDTETTGLKPDDGHRVIEIGCVELINHVPTGRTFHTYINPERDVPPEASAVSGLTTEFLRPYPLFAKIINDFVSFVGDAPLVIHNAAFDMKFINAEFSRLDYPLWSMNRTIDTVMLARRKFPGSPANLDALCRRFQIDLSGRTKHGALIDAQLLAKVYLELIGGRQKSFAFDKNTLKSDSLTAEAEEPRRFHPSRQYKVSTDELSAHQTQIKSIKNALWGI